MSRSRHLDSDMKAEIREVFDIFDTDKSGTIDRHELKVGLRAMGFDTTKEEVQRFMDEYDRNKLGYLSLKEFEKVIIKKMSERSEEDEIRTIFKLFQQEEKIGRIYIRDLQRVVKEIGSELTDDEIQEMFNTFDTDGRGWLSEEQFINIIKGGTDTINSRSQ